MNFRRHTTIGTVCGYVASSVLLYKGMVDPITSICIIFASFIGSFLPDIDSNCSKSFNIFISVSSFLSGFAVILYCGKNYPNDIKWWIWIPLALYIVFRYFIGKIIKKMTTHRGIIHSLPAVVASGLICLTLLRLFDVELMMARYISGAISLGFLSHILADEFHSRVNFDEGHFNWKVKNSANTAWDVGDIRGWSTYVCYMLIMALSIYNFI